MADVNSKASCIFNMREITDILQSVLLLISHIILLIVSDRLLDFVLADETLTKLKFRFIGSDLCSKMEGNASTFERNPNSDRLELKCVFVVAVNRENSTFDSRSALK